ncbi:hypothetical protein ACFQ0P_07515 [Microbacterium insulae]|uniref:Uncharacterized protein n=1 Tax=Microbacterium insulae TaxID=483014 RepID=A0ABW3AHI5_9MICO
MSALSPLRRISVPISGLQTSSIVPVNLGELEEEGFLTADPLRATRKQGERVVYRVHDAVVTELYLWLGQEIGEVESCLPLYIGGGTAHEAAGVALARRCCLDASRGYLSI